MSLLDRLAGALADRIHQGAEVRAVAQGLEVVRLPGGRREYRDPMLSVYAERRRLRLLREGLDPLDRHLLDAGTAAAFAGTAARHGLAIRPEIAATARPPAAPRSAPLPPRAAAPITRAARA